MSGRDSCLGADQHASYACRLPPEGVGGLLPRGQEDKRSPTTHRPFGPCTQGTGPGLNQALGPRPSTLLESGNE